MMTPQETEALRGFLAQLTQVQGITKDQQATAMIAAAFAQQPDAGYLLAQRAMLLDLALASARAEIEQVQNQLQREREQSRAGSGNGNNNGSSSAGGFLDPASSWGRSGNDLARASGAPGPTGRPDPRPDQRYEAAAPYGQSPAPMQRPGLFGGGGGSFLGNMAATAAGVAGGAFLFQGLSGLMGNHGSGSMGEHGAARPGENGTTNNLFDAAPNAAQDSPARLAGGAGSNADNSGLSDGLDNGIDDLAGNDDFSGQDDVSST